MKEQNVAKAYAKALIELADSQGLGYLQADNRL